MGKSKSQLLGFKYFLGIHMGICRGPVDTLVEIQVGDRKAWPVEFTELVSGTGTAWVSQETILEDGSVLITGSNVTVPEDYLTTEAPDPITESGQIYINQPELFGGDKKEGGIVGYADIMMGEPTQGVNARLAAMLGAGSGELVSAFRGMFTIYYHGQVCSMSPYPKPWKFRVRRALKGWNDDDVFYPAIAKIGLTVIQPLVKGGPPMAQDIWAMNPAHIIWECITNEDWGRGLSSMFLDEASFTDAADALYAEGFGLCIKWMRQDTIDSFVQLIIDHISGALYVDRLTGLITLKLIRSDYDIEDLPVFTTSTGIVSIEDDDSNTSQMQINEIIVKFVDPIRGEDRQVRAQNLASIQTTGSAFSKTIEYPGVPIASLAARLAQRDLRVHGTQLRRFKITMDRRGYLLQPGAVFVYNDTLRNIENMVLRVGKVEDTPEGRIVITCVQDIFGIPAYAYTGTQGFPGGIDTEPVEPTYGDVEEASYIDIKTAFTLAEFDALTGEEAFLMMLGARPPVLPPATTCTPVMTPLALQIVVSVYGPPQQS